MRYLGVDYGLRKVGLALSEGQIASPFKVLDINGLADGINKVAHVIKQEEIDRVVVGVPESGEAKKAVKNFISGLMTRLKESQVSVIATDETLSSSTAKNLMIELDLSKEARKKEDAFSASLILQNFLDSIA